MYLFTHTHLIPLINISMKNILLKFRSFNLKSFSIYLLLSFILFTGMKCKKEEIGIEALPPITQEGKNTFGFLLNGEVWVPYSRCRTFNDPCRKISARYGFPDAEEFGIGFQFAREREKANKSSALTIYNLIGANITSLGNKIDSIGVNFRGENSFGNTDDYSRLQPGSKFIITKFDTVNRIISGEFEFILNEDSGSGKQIILKNGRFDFKMNACLCD